MLVGGAGCQARTPDWVANLRTNSGAAVSVDRTVVKVRAEEFSGAEREDMRRELWMVWPQIDTYEKRAGRGVPVFGLVPT